MTKVVKVAEAKTHLSDLLARVERGEDFVIARGARPVARLTGIDDAARRRQAIAALKAERDRLGGAPTTMDELVAWKREDHGR